MKWYVMSKYGLDFRDQQPKIYTKDPLVFKKPKLCCAVYAETRGCVSDLSYVSEQHLKPPAGNAVGNASQCQEVSAKKALNEKCYKSTTLSKMDVPQALQCPMDH